MGGAVSFFDALIYVELSRLQVKIVDWTLFLALIEQRKKKRVMLFIITDVKQQFKWQLNDIKPRLASFF